MYSGYKKRGAVSATVKFATMVMAGIFRFEIEVKETMAIHGQQRVANPVVLQTTRNGQMEVDPYDVLGIKSLEKGGGLGNWIVAFWSKLTVLFATLELVFDDAEEVYVLNGLMR